MDSSGLRPMRAMNLSNALIDKGHQVVLWASDFDHFSKKHRTGKASIIRVSENLEIRLISSRGYKSHVGLSRLFDHAQLGFNLKKELKNQKPPDVAFVGYPPIETAWVMTNWLAKLRIPTMVDVKDAWPDVLLRAFPKAFRGVARLLLTPYFLMMRSIFKKASALSSISEPFLAWSLEAAKRVNNQFDSVAILTSPDEDFPQKELENSRIFWDSMSVTDKSNLRCFYVGSLTETLNFDGVIFAAQNSDIEFVIAGTGPTEKTLRLATKDLPNVIMPGWVSSTQAKVLADRSTFMLAPYANLEDFSISLPNKFLDAMKYSKPILTSIPGYAASFVEKKGIGIVYSNKDLSSLLATLKKFREDPNTIASLATNSAAVFEELFTFDKVYGELVCKLQLLANFD
jgi:glycosyltransferase involved in cell wall biosynthesis